MEAIYIIYPVNHFVGKHDTSVTLENTTAIGPFRICRREINSQNPRQRPGNFEQFTRSVVRVSARETAR